MKIIINTSNLTVGGGVQVALSFIEGLKRAQGNEYIVFLSAAVKSQMDIDSFPLNFRFFSFERSPARINARKKLIVEFNAIEDEVKPDIVFTVFGPAYWKPRSQHVMGFALPWLINPESKVHRLLSIKNRLKYFFLKQYQAYFVKRDSDYYIVETIDVRSRLSKYLGIKYERIFVVGNTHSEVFNSFECFKRQVNQKQSFKFVTISANYIHKNLDILNKVIPILRSRNIDCRFYLTISNTDFDNHFLALDDYVTNIGPVGIDECVQLYKDADALFLPTLLECFSASYPEAMKMELPILTSDLDFAHAICGDAAEFFDPLDPIDIATRIAELIDDSSRRNKLISLGKERLKSFPTAQKRADMYLELCRNIIDNPANTTN